MNLNENQVRPIRGITPLAPWTVDPTEPSSDIEALMRTAPHETPPQSLQSRLAVKDVIGAAFAALTDEETWIINSIYSEQQSLRATARQLGAPKTTVARIRDRALAKLRKELSESAEARIYLERIGLSEAIVVEGDANGSLPVVGDETASIVTEVSRSPKGDGGSSRQETGGLREGRRPVRKRTGRSIRSGAGPVDRRGDSDGGQDASPTSGGTGTESSE